MFIHSLLVGSKNEFCIGSLTSLKGSGLWRTPWCPQNLFQTPYKSPVWSGCEKRGDACLAETPLLHIHVQIYGGRFIKHGKLIQSTFSGYERPSEACRVALSWKNNGRAAGLENKPPRFATRVQKEMLQRTKKEHNINNKCVSEHVQGYISAFMASLDW